MPDDLDSQRKPFGERDAEERKLPFGARPPVRPDSPYQHEPPRRPAQEEPDPPPTVDIDEAEPLTPFKPRTSPSEAQPDQRYAERASTRLEDVLRENGEHSNGAPAEHADDAEPDIEIEDEPE